MIAKSLQPHSPGDCHTTLQFIICAARPRCWRNEWSTLYDTAWSAKRPPGEEDSLIRPCRRARSRSASRLLTSPAEAGILWLAGVATRTNRKRRGISLSCGSRPGSQERTLEPTDTPVQGTQTTEQAVCQCGHTWLQHQFYDNATHRYLGVPCEHYNCSCQLWMPKR